MNDGEKNPAGPVGTPHVSSRAWVRRLSYALRGIAVGVFRESNFAIYALSAVGATAVGAWVGLSAEGWAVVALATAFVLVAEMFNSSIEHLARAITRETHPEIRDALDVASGAVLMASIGAVVVAALVLVWPLVERFT